MEVCDSGLVCGIYCKDVYVMGAQAIILKVMHTKNMLWWNMSA
jgi:hypothetical protein